MTVVLTGLGSARPRATVSALAELGSALHVLNEPAHHTATDWATRVRGNLRESTLRRVEEWAWLTQAIRATPFVPAEPSGGVADELERLGDAEPADLARGLLRPVARDGDNAAALRWAHSRGPTVTRHVKQLIDVPEHAVAAFLDFLQAVVDDWFGEEWGRIEPRLRAHARQFSDTVERFGSVEAICALDPAITRTDDDTVSIAKVQSRRYDVGARGLLCVPSAYIQPHVHLSEIANRPLTMLYSIEGRSKANALTVPQLIRRLETAANAGRLEVARAIASEPRTAGEVASLWNLDTTQVNRHLRALARAGLARTTRRGRYVQYTLDHDAIATLGDELRDALLR